MARKDKSFIRNRSNAPLETRDNYPPAPSRKLNKIRFCDCKVMAKTKQTKKKKQAPRKGEITLIMVSLGFFNSNSVLFTHSSSSTKASFIMLLFWQPWILG